MNKKLILGLGAVATVVVVAFVLEPDTSVTNAEQLPASLPSPTSKPQDTLQTNPAPSSQTAAASVSGGVMATDVPEYTEVEARPSEVELWQLNQAEPDTVWDGNPAKQLQTAPELIEQFHVGQTLHLHLPHRDMNVEATLNSTHNQTARVNVFHGKITNGHPEDNVIVTRGKIETHVVISTHEGVYTAVIDNASGDTVIVDQADIVVNQIPFEDGIYVEPVEQGPPPS